MQLTVSPRIDLEGFDRYKIIYIGFLDREKTAVSY
jgi:hypothetical protein